MKKIPLLILLLFTLMPMYGKDIYFQTLGCTEGLSQSSAIAIWQDNIGRMWFGNDALNCYDGENVQVYRLSEYFKVEDANVRVICGNNSFLFCLAEDHLIGMELSTNNFIFPAIKANAICCQNDKLYYSEKNKLYIYDPFTQTQDEVYTISDENTQVLSICINQEEQIWLGTNTGLYIIDKNNASLLSHQLETETIINLYLDSQNSTWLICNSRKLYRGESSGILHMLSFQSKDGITDSLPSSLYSITEDIKGCFWIGSLTGIFQLLPSAEGENIFLIDDLLLKEATVFALYTDLQGTVWIGSYYGDIRFYNPDVNNYMFYSVNEKYPDNLYGVVTGCMAEDKKGNLYIATEGSGINILARNGNIKHITQEDGNLPNNKIRTLWLDEKYDRLFISPYMKGFHYIDLNTNELKPTNDTILKTVYQRIIEKVIPYQNYLLLLTQDGLYKLDRRTLNVSLLFDDNSELNRLCSGIIRTIHIDDRNVLWVSSHEEGLLTIDLKTNKILRYYGDGLKDESEIPSAVINICGDTRKGLFMVTLKSGILSYSFEKDSFICYTEENSQLLSNICYNIDFTEFGSLVITTNKGICLINAFSLNDFKNAIHIPFAPHLPLKGLNGDCGLYISPLDGKIYVGGLYGLLSFFEQDQKIEKKNYSLFFSSLGINGREILPPSPILEKNIHLTEHLELPYSKNTISLSFASSDYLTSSHVKYEYMLEGLNPQWIQTTYKTITYNSLPPGSYKLFIREQDHYEKSISLSFHIKPPFWQSRVAFILYIIVGCLALWWIIRFNNSKAILRLSLELEKREMEQIEKSNKNKIEFFTHISNEFRTPLTLIITLLDRLSEQVNTSGQGKIEKIKKHAFRLQELISELLDFRKMEDNQLRLKVGYYNFSLFLKEIYSMFTEYAYEKGILYKFLYTEEPIYLWFDQKQLQKVFYNLIFTTFRIVNENGEIKVFIHPRNSYIEIIIQGTRSTLEEEDLIKLHQLFQNETSKMDLSFLPDAGMGLIFSKGIIQLHKGEILFSQEKGTITFVIKLQTEKIQFEEEDIENTQSSPYTIEIKKPDSVETETLPEEKKKRQTTIRNIKCCWLKATMKSEPC